MKKTFILIILSLFLLFCVGGAYAEPVEPDENEHEKLFMLHYENGKLLLDKDEFEKAAEEFSAVIETNSEYTEAFFNRGLSFAYLGEYEKALEDFTQVLKVNSNDGDAYYNRGNVHFDQGDYEKAIEDYKNALEIDSEDEEAEYNLNLANFYLENNRIDSDESVEENQEQHHRDTESAE